SGSSGQRIFASGLLIGSPGLHRMSSETPRAHRLHPMTTLERLRERMAELDDLRALEMLAEWDLLVMMPKRGAEGRARQLGTLARLTDERATADELGELLEELDSRTDLDELDRDIVRIGRRDWERARRVPSELAAELSSAHAAGQEIWSA